MCYVWLPMRVLTMSVNLFWSTLSKTENNTIKQYILNGKFYSSQVFYKYKKIFLHAMDIDGNTHLHLAAQGNQAEICEIFLKYDTEIITLLNKKDETARKNAKNNSYKDVLNALKAEYEISSIVFSYFKIALIDTVLAGFFITLPKVFSKDHILWISIMYFKVCRKNFYVP